MIKRSTLAVAKPVESIAPEIPSHTAEGLVGFGFRCWLTGYQSGDLSHWELVWCRYSTVLGAQDGRAALNDLSTFVRSVRDTAVRPIKVCPAAAAGFCRDECMAISLVAACQNGVCPAARACAFALLGSSIVNNAVSSAEALATTMNACGLHLSAGSVQNAAASFDVRSAPVN